MLLALAGLRLSFIDGLWRRASIDGPSMVPALRGASYALTCADCRFPFRCDAEHLPADRLTACPNCGYARNKIDDGQRLPPESVVVDRWPLLLQSPRRGALVACQVPGDPGQLAVKRVAALPGEQLAIRGGDLYADGKLVRKTLAELRTLKLLLYDDAYRPRGQSQLPPRWRGPSDDTKWQPSGNGWQRPALDDDSAGGPADWDWLEYQHWACTADERLRGKPTAVRDNDSYNQGETRRPLNAVPDVLLTCRLQATSEGELAFAAADGKQRFAVIIEPAKRVSVQADGKQLLELPINFDFSRDSLEIEFGLCDQQILLAVQGRTLIRLPYERSGKASEETLHPLAVGVRGLAAKISQLRVWRDLYYLNSHGLALPWELPAAPASAGFALLGDNPPVSVDSRQWEPALVPASAIRGVVYRTFWTSE